MSDPDENPPAPVNISTEASTDSTRIRLRFGKAIGEKVRFRSALEETIREKPLDRTIAEMSIEFRSLN